MAHFDRSHIRVPVGVLLLLWGRKSQFLHSSFAFDATVGETPSEYCHNVLCGKARMVGLPDGEKKFEHIIIVYAFRYSTWTWQMDGQTPHDGLGRAVCVASCDKTEIENIIPKILKMKKMCATRQVAIHVPNTVLLKTVRRCPGGRPVPF